MAKRSRKLKRSRSKLSKKAKTRRSRRLRTRQSMVKVGKIFGEDVSVDPAKIERACGKKPGFFSSKSTKEMYEMCSKLSPQKLDKVLSNCLYGTKMGSDGYKLCLSGIGGGKFGVNEQSGVRTYSTD